MQPASFEIGHHLFSDVANRSPTKIFEDFCRPRQVKYHFKAALILAGDNDVGDCFFSVVGTAIDLTLPWRGKITVDQTSKILDKEGYQLLRVRNMEDLKGGDPLYLTMAR